MSAISAQCCFSHPTREAAARCPECARSFCRECVTEHNGRVICAACLARLGRGAGAVRARLLDALAGLARCAAGLLVLWLIFFALGAWLLRIPASFHEGLMWEEGGK
jgi:hypothetical protein